MSPNNYSIEWDHEKEIFILKNVDTNETIRESVNYKEIKDYALTLEPSGETNPETVIEPSFKKRGMKLLVIFGIILPLLWSVGFYYVTEYIYSNKTIVEIINKGEITAFNTTPGPFIDSKNTNEDIEKVKANINQKSLGKDSSISTPAYFGFWNGKDIAGTKRIDVFLDLGEQRSRDFILLNQNVLKTSVENGDVLLNVYIVPTSNLYSLYGAEALALSFIESPTKSWDFFIKLVEKAALSDTNSSQDILDQIVNAATDSGIRKINKTNIKEGIFSHWLLTTGYDKRLNTGYYPPLVYVDNTLVDTTKNILNNPNTLHSLIYQGE